MASQAQPAHRFYVHACEEGRSHAHLIPDAVSLQDAALGFAEHWASRHGAVKVIAFDGDTGEERCFTIDVSGGEISPCA
jgi:hypothetical protein